MSKDFSIGSSFDAFLALSQIDDDEVSGMIKPKKKVTEGKSFSINFSTEDLEKAKEFLNSNEVETELEVIDADADSINHIKNKEDYIGQAILKCNKCQRTRFMDLNNLVTSENDEELYNEEDECPYCKTSGDGYELVGQVGKVEKDETEDVTQDETNNEETATEETNDETVNEEPVEEVSLDNDESTEDVTFDNDINSEVEDEFALPEFDDVNNNDETNEDETAEDENKDEETEDETNEALEEDVAEDEVKEEEPKKKLQLRLKKTNESVQHIVSESGYFNNIVEEIDDDIDDMYGKDLLKESSLTEYFGKKAWMLNQIISCMNDEGAYYGSWLYTWPDGETEEECKYDFGTEEDFEALEKLFRRIYKAYHNGGLYNAPEEVEAAAHVYDDELGLAPIENIKDKHMHEAVEEEVPEDDAEEPMMIKDLLDCIIEPENIDNILVLEGDKELFQGILADMPEDLFKKEFYSFNVGESKLNINVDTEDDETEDVVDDFLGIFDDEETDQINVTEVGSSESLMEGTKEEVLDKFGNAVFVSIEAPEYLEINVAPIEGEEEPEDDEDDTPVEESIKNNTKPYSLFEAICEANGLATYRKDKIGTIEYWINETLNGDCDDFDLKTIYEAYVEGYGKVLEAEFKKETGYRETLTETLNEAKSYDKGDFIVCHNYDDKPVSKYYTVGTGSAARFETEQDAIDFISDNGSDPNWNKHFYIKNTNETNEACVKTELTEEYTRKQMEEFNRLCKQYGVKTIEDLNKLCAEIGIVDPLTALRKWSRKLGQDFEIENEELHEDIVDDIIASGVEAPVEEPPVKELPVEPDPIKESATAVMAAYQNANKHLDSVKEAIYTKMNCPFFSSYVHELAHTMPGRFDKFGDILHTINMEIPYPTTEGMVATPENIKEAFNVIFAELNDIKAALNEFIKCTDEKAHGMACAAESLLNDIEGEFPMLFRLEAKAEECGDDTVSFDKFVGQYVEHKDDLLESLNEKKCCGCQSFKTRQELGEAIAECRNNNRPFRIERSKTEGYRYDLITEEKVNEVAPLVAAAVTAAASGAASTVADRVMDKVLGEDKESEDDAIEGELLPPVETSDEKAVTPTNMSDEEVAVMQKIGRIANDISQAIEKYYNIEANPALIVADILQDLRLISGSLNVQDLEDNIVNRATANMFNDYTQTYELVDQIMSDLTGKEIHTTPEQKIQQAIASLDSPAFYPENIDKGIGSVAFLEAAKDGQVPFITEHELPMLEDFDPNKLELKGDPELAIEADSDYKADQLELEAEKEAEFDAKEFDEALNKHFTEVYNEAVVYHTERGSMSDLGRIVLEGVIESTSFSRPITFTLTPKVALSEELKTAEDVSDAVKNIDFVVENDVSDEKFEYTFSNEKETPNVKFADDKTAAEIMAEFDKEYKGDAEFEFINDKYESVANWEYVRNMDFYIENGYTEPIIKSHLMTSIQMDEGLENKRTINEFYFPGLQEWGCICAWAEANDIDPEDLTMDDASKIAKDLANDPDKYGEWIKAVSKDRLKDVNDWIKFIKFGFYIHSPELYGEDENPYLD